jgi:hypothetical protein
MYVDFGFYRHTYAYVWTHSHTNVYVPTHVCALLNMHDCGRNSVKQDRFTQTVIILGPSCKNIGV